MRNIVRDKFITSREELHLCRGAAAAAAADAREEMYEMLTFDALRDSLLSPPASTSPRVF